MTQHIQEVAQRADRAATLAVTAALARRQVLLQRRHQEAVATARRSAIIPGCSWPASGSSGNAARVSRLGRWPGSGSKA